VVSPDDRRAVALAHRRHRTVVRRRVDSPSTVDDDVLAAPDPREPEEDKPVRRVVRRPRPRPQRSAPKTGTPKSGTPEPRQGNPWTTRVLALVLVAGLVAAGLLGRQWYDGRQLDAARQQALAAARQEVTDFVSISSSTVDSDLARIAAGASGEFKDEFTRDMPQVRAAVVQNKVDSKGTVLRAAVVSSDRRTAVVLVAVDATVKNTNAPDGRLSHYRIQVSLTRDGSGRWLVSQLQFVG
jgi:Mce-associated membrane protein